MKIVAALVIAMAVLLLGALGACLAVVSHIGTTSDSGMWFIYDVWLLIALGGIALIVFILTYKSKGTK